MKAKVLLLIMVCLTTFSFGTYAQDKNSKKNSKEEIVFEVPMDCHSCQKKIEKNIPFEKGVSNLKVDFDSKTVMVQYNPNKTNVGNLQKAFEKLGYKASLYTPEEQKN
ncbi:MAG: heavy metal-associated domain-containing protein [Dysgonomonas sp.]|nr:heavy metal-associated domain-containing protein [Dysgonomonas sp.]